MEVLEGSRGSMGVYLAKTEFLARFLLEPPLVCYMLLLVVRMKFSVCWVLILAL